MQSFAFEVVVHCPVELVFEIYIDIDRWRNRSIFGEISWVKGSPWQEGSRLTIETRVPFRSMVDQVVQNFAENESVSYLSHVLGITSETHIMFVRVSPGETLIRVRMNLVGKVSRVLGFAIEPMILNTTKRFFADLARECEAAAQDVGAHA
jgi:hypothetical protein